MAAKGSVASKRPYEVMMEELANIATLESNGNVAFEIASQVIDQIAAATSPEEIFAANDSGPADMSDYIGRPIGISEVRYFKSSEAFAKGSLGVYAVLKVVTENGGEALISVGAPNVVASVRQAQKLGLIQEDGKPFWCMVRSRVTPNGTLFTLHSHK